MPNKQPFEVQNVQFEVVQGDKIATIKIPSLVNNHLLQASLSSVAVKPNVIFGRFEMPPTERVQYNMILSGRLETMASGEAYSIHERHIDSPPPPTTSERELIALVKSIESELIEWTKDITANPWAPRTNQPTTMMTDRGRLRNIKSLIEKFYKKNPEYKDDQEDDFGDLLD